MQIERFDMGSTYHSPGGIRVTLTRERRRFPKTKQENNCLINQWLLEIHDNLIFDTSIKNIIDKFQQRIILLLKYIINNENILLR